jgi:hypothetical protein
MKRANHGAPAHDSIGQQSPLVRTKCLSREEPAVARAKDRYLQLSDFKGFPFPKWNLRSWAERVNGGFFGLVRQE